MPPDDIRIDNAASESAGKPQSPPGAGRMVGPESEVRGGSEAPDSSADEDREKDAAEKT